MLIAVSIFLLSLTPAAPSITDFYLHKKVFFPLIATLSVDGHITEYSKVK